MYFTQSDIGKFDFNSEDLRFLRDQVSFNFDLVNQKQFRLPAYRNCRFANEDDLNVVVDRRKKLYNKVDGYKSKSRAFPTLSYKIANLARTRLSVEDHHYCSNLVFCTPWLKKDFPKSVQRNKILTRNNTNMGDKIGNRS